MKINRFIAVFVAATLMLSLIPISVSASTGYTQEAVINSSNTGTLFLSAGKIYRVEESTTVNGVDGNAGIEVEAGATVVLYIPAGQTLNVYGEDGFGKLAGTAGIRVPSNSTLIIIGAGTLNAYGGKGGDGNDGVNANYYNYSSGAPGGNGGGAGGAGIGGNGGNGGNGGDGGNWKTDELPNYGSNVYNGGNGNNGGNGETMGTVYIIGAVTVNPVAGEGSTKSGDGGKTGGTNFGNATSGGWKAGDGGGGGGGAAGGEGTAIGGGGRGGGGGGGGASADSGLNGGGGGGGGGKNYGAGGYSISGGLVNGGQGSEGGGGRGGNSPSGATKNQTGGNGGNPGEKGGDGTLLCDTARTVGGRTAGIYSNLPDAIRYTLTFNSSFGGKAADTAGTTSADVWLAIKSGNITPPTLACYEFKGYYSEQNGAGTQYYGADGACLREWDKIGDKSLYAYWVKRACEFTVTIPEAVGIGVEGQMTLGAELKYFLTSESLSVGLSYPAGGFKLKLDSAQLNEYIALTIYTDAAKTGIVSSAESGTLTFIGEEKNSATYAKSLWYSCATPTYAGDYKATLTFTVTLNN